MLHFFHSSIRQIPMPEAFTFPFHYTPHPLCIMAAEAVQAYLKYQIQWKEELDAGKMFGVLVVKTPDGRIGYLAAFSGNLAHSNCHPFFVPPIFDMLEPNGFFKKEEAQISAINEQLTALLQAPALQEAKTALQQALDERQQQLEQARTCLKEGKRLRDERRVAASEKEQQLLIRESQHQKAEYKRLERRWQDCVQEKELQLAQLTQPIESLKKERKNRSAELQQQLFEAFQILNACGETKTLLKLFKHTPQQIPPAGAGECAAPKLLQYAYLHALTPLAMAEFWWGASPKTELRIHGNYYPACKNKCEPILNYMMQGLQVESNPLASDRHRQTELEIIYEDEWLMIINKPEGMLSVPGKLDVDSVYDRIHRLRPQATGPLIVHRLDMATSGLLLIAKTKEVHKRLQALFKNRKIRKEYVAILEGEVISTQGDINLPLCLNPHDRPRQTVHPEFGKVAITHYQVESVQNGLTRILFYPLTGRTHQLRVHAAHPQGLNTPILGDALYGKASSRLYLHAQRLSFVHPITGEHLTFHCDAPF